MKKLLVVSWLLSFACFVSAQQLYFPKSDYSDSAAVEKNIPLLANKLEALYHNADKTSYYDILFRLQIVAQKYDAALHSLKQYELAINDTAANNADNFPYKVYCATRKHDNNNESAFLSTYKQEFKIKYDQLGYKDQEIAARYFKNPPSNTFRSFNNRIKALGGRDSLTVAEAVALCKTYCTYKVYASETAIANTALAELEHENYVTDDSVLVKMPDGGKIALTIIRNRKISVPQPVVLMYDIYAGNEESYCKQAVHKGYVGIVANTRGKRLSTDAIEPFEHDAKDAYYIIDWISKQPWCNGKVGMYGGSYLGFAQWSAVKYRHPALKTIVPQVSVGVGIDYPMQNNVFSTDMLRWLHRVTNNKLTDYDEYADSSKWNKVFNKWYNTGASFRSLDTIDGRPNAIFQRWLKHPGYDSYWQSMTPQKEEFAKINIPILTTTGYWDDDQLGAMYYYKQYFKWNKNPDYYLVIGPYDHSGSQANPKKFLAAYQPDSIAFIPIKDLVFEWFDYILKGAKRPDFLKDKVNYEVMGENKWHHVASLDKMHNDTLTFYLGNKADNKQYPLLDRKPGGQAYISQTVNLAERYAQPPIGEDIGAFDKLVNKALNPAKDKMVFTSKPVDKPFAISGSFVASLIANINKRDLDIVIDLYEQLPDGKYLALSENVQRASYAKDRSKRQLLKPGKKEKIEIKNTFITSVRLEKGSRIIVLIGVNKSNQWQINYGTGKDVSDENMEDAQLPLRIKWYNNSFIKFPVLK